MGTVCHSIYTIFIVLLAVRLSYSVGHKEKLLFVRSPEPIAVPIGDEFTLACEMNVKPDRFRWRHFPISSPYSNAPLKIDRTHAVEVLHNLYTSTGEHTTVTINVNSTDIAGDYQCLAIYGSSVLASVPGRVTIADIGKNPPPNTSTIYVSPGNTVAIRCDLPTSNPAATVQYYKSNVPLSESNVLPTGTLLLKNTSNYDAGSYTCAARNYITDESRMLEQKTFLTVTNTGQKEEPRFLTRPPSNYTVTAGEDVFMECSAVGTPPPKVTWYKLGGKINSDRFEMLPGGVSIKNISASDEGVYVCVHGNLQHHIALLFYQRPTVSFPKLSDIKEGQNFDFECDVNGTPDPIVSWLINGYSVLNDSNIEVVGNKIYFRPIEKRHAGILQCLASNIIGADYAHIFIHIYPKPVYGESTTSATPHVRTTSKITTTRKSTFMVPPSKPIVTRLSDESVMVRWSVPENKGLPIRFFKVQYRELGPASHSRLKGSRWKTTNADILPHLRSYQVDNLKSDYIYKFRIAAVYSNDDNKNGPNSIKFHLKRENFSEKNPLPAPRLTHTEAMTANSIKIYWECIPNSNISVDGFYVNYQLTSSAGDYFKATVDDEQTRSYIITHLLSDTSYDIKLQSYTISGVSEFSAVLRQKTLRAIVDTSTTPSITTPSIKEESGGPPQLYIIIGAAILGVALLVGGILVFVICKKKKEKDKDASQGGNDRGDKIGGVNEDRGHHIQVGSNGYISKSIPRSLSNGCGPPTNRITITANPLADADDNQNQNMIEMSCLSSQNNNCAAVEPSASNDSVPSVPSKLKTTDSLKTRGKLKTEPAAGGNYV